MAKFKPVGNNCCCCDCFVKHNVVGCTKCLPETLCVKAEFLSGVECCQFASGQTHYLCREDGYLPVPLYCGDIGITASFQLHIVDDECCFTMTLTLGEDSVSFSKCGDNFEVGFDEQEFTLFTPDYPPVEVTGLISVAPAVGVSNNGQRGDLSLGEPPPCPLIKMNPRSDPPDLSIEDCTRPELSVASETAARTFGEDFATQIAAGNLNSDEFCWFLSPCQCVPNEVCLTYTAYNICDGYVRHRAKLQLADCVYGPETFSVDRGGIYPDVITVTGELNTECEIIWKVESDAGEVAFTYGLTRIELNGAHPKNYIKRCDVTLDETEVPGTDATNGNIDMIMIDEDCYCLEDPDAECPGACFDVRMPPGANPDCHLAVLTGTIIQGSCEFSGSAAFHAATYEQPPSITQGFLQPDETTCQLYHAYNTDVLGFFLDLISCTSTGYPGDPFFGDQTDATVRWTLYYPSSCVAAGGDPVPPAPMGYRLMYEFVANCGFEQETTSGTVSPTYASCDPFELIFEMPFNAPCDCGCSSFQLRITL